MKIRVTSHLPSRFHAAKGLIDQTDIRCNRGRLRAKLLIFATPRDLQKAWKKISKFPLGRRCLGAVNGLCTYSEDPNGVRSLEVDARYFCVIGLCRKHLTMRIISHEAVHAGHAFAKRRARSWWDVISKDFDEEAIAYPTGEIAAGIVAWLNRRGHLPV